MKTPAQQLGYKAGDKFTVLIHYHFDFEYGEEVTLVEDDGSSYPLFISANNTTPKSIDLGGVVTLQLTYPKAKDLGQKYSRTLYCKDTGNEIVADVYTVLEGFSTGCSALDHAIKKLLCAGSRGHKDMEVDKLEAINSIHRSIELDKNRK